MTSTRSQKILILGVTASGKARLAFDLAKHLNGEIISVDSMKVYRRMDIGTAKPSAERRAEVPYHMIDVVEPSDAYDVATFGEQARWTMKQVHARRRPAILVGGTALYIKSLLFGLFAGPASDEGVRRRLKEQASSEGLASLHRRLATVDPASGERINKNDERRIVRALEVFELTGRPISSLQTQFDAGQMASDWTIIGLRREKAVECRRINARVKRMIEAGLLEEVRSLLAEAVPLSRQARTAIGYAEMIRHLGGEMDWEECVERIKINTRRLAKGQRTWFKTFDFVKWISLNEASTPNDVLESTLEILPTSGGPWR